MYFFPFKEGIFSIKVRWVRKEQTSHRPHPITNAMALNLYRSRTISPTLESCKKIMLKFADSNILVKVTWCCLRTNCTYFFGEQADFFDVFFHNKSDFHCYYPYIHFYNSKNLSGIMILSSISNSVSPVQTLS